jgi:AraC-like DNA-binding protein
MSKAKKPIFEKVPLTNQASFLYKEESFSRFDVPWHHHPEYEIVHIASGSGEMVIGNTAYYFKEDDVLLIGPNLSHLWKSRQNDHDPGIQRIIQFTFDFLGQDFFEKYEFRSVYTLLKQSELGLLFQGKTKKEIIDKISGLQKSDDFRKLMTLFDILQLMATSKEYKSISSPGFKNMYALFDEDRMNKIYDYTLKNFRKDISTSEVAALANLELSAFCRYFKKRTKKTYVDFLNEVRLGHSCKLLQEMQYSVSQICFMSGYKNLSNFNRQFKAMYGRTPKEYRKTMF